MPWAFSWRIAPLVVSMAILGLYAYFVTVNGWWALGGDAEAYLLAAERVAAGDSPYRSDGLPPAQLYRYAPWLAFAMVPLTVLPRDVVMGGIALLALVAALAALWPLLRAPTYETLALLLLIAPPLLHSAWIGNVQALMVAAVMYLPVRGVWIGLAASLKGAPLALIVPDMAARRWKPVALAVMVAAVGVLPMLAFDLSSYPTHVTGGLWAVSPLLTIAVGITGVAVTFIVTRTTPRYAMIAGAGTVVLASPYLLLSYLSWLLVAFGQTAPMTSREVVHVVSRRTS